MTTPASVFHLDQALAAVPDGFRYASDVNERWLGIEDLRRLLGRTAA